MRRAKHTVGQMIAAVKQMEAGGRSAAEVDWGPRVIELCAALVT